MNQDTRNLIDRYKGQPVEEIVRDLDSKGTKLQIAIDNIERDFNMGTIVRSANAFGVRLVHVIGRRQWNKRGAMMTDKYLQVKYHSEIDDFLAATASQTLIAVDNTLESSALHSVELPANSILIFGSESSGVRPELLKAADKIVAIEQFGSTRSLNVGVAAGIAMYAWLQQNHLPAKPGK